MIQGTTKGPTPVGYPYHSLSPELKEHWRILDEMKTVPFHRWNQQAMFVWMETKLGQCVNIMCMCMHVCMCEEI